MTLSKFELLDPKLEANWNDSNTQMNLLDQMANLKSFENKNSSSVQDSYPLPGVDLDVVAKVEAANSVKTYKDKSGASHTDYRLNGRLVFSDVNDHGQRIRTSFNMGGGVEGQKIDYADGRSVSQFAEGTHEYRINRSANGIVIKEKDIMGNWVKLSEQDECTAALNAERAMFTAPKNYQGV